MRRFASLLTLALALSLGGCCACRDSYNAFLTQIQDNLENDIGKKYKGYLDADEDREQRLKDNDWAVVEDTVASIKRVREHGPEQKEEKGE